MIFFGSIRSNLFNQILNDLVLLAFNLSWYGFFEIVILNIEELIEELSNWFLVYMVDEVVNDFGFRSEYIWDQILLFPVDEECNQLCEVASQYSIDGSVSSLHKLEQSVQ